MTLAVFRPRVPDLIRDLLTNVEAPDQARGVGGYPGA